MSIFYKLLDKYKITMKHSLRFLSISRTIQEKKSAKLASIRNAIIEIYSCSKNGNFNWIQTRNELINREIHVPTNFEFVILSAFDQNIIAKPLEQDLFVEIASYVGQSKTVLSNKIASIRFCLFLSQYSKFLTEEHIHFIRNIAQFVANNPGQIDPVIVDTMQSLSKSSRENCRLALELLPKFLTESKSFSLKLDLLNILFKNIVFYELGKECHQFLQDYVQFLNVDFQTLSELLKITSTTNFTQNDLLEIIKNIGQMYTGILNIDLKILIDKILKEKLKYKNIEKAFIDPQNGRCICCGNTLTGLSKEEFVQLKQNFKSIIFDLNDKFLLNNLVVNQLELLEFESKILLANENNEPLYDLIIDGLNSSYRISKSIVHDKSGLRNYAKIFKIKDIDNQLVTLIESNKLLFKFNHLLLIGRNHMKTWFQLKQFCKKHKDKIDLNLLLNNTRDDNFILYAAIQHPNTLILSGDHFRDHRNKFAEWYRNSDWTMEEQPKPNLDRLFQRWLRSTQIKIEKSKILKYPDRYDIKFHLHPNNNSQYPTIHIPVINRLCQETYNDDCSISWICARPSK